MVITRQQKRAQTQSRAKRESAQRVYIRIPEEFTDCLGGPWTAQTSEGIVEFSFLDVLLSTVRRCTVQSAEDSERALELISTIKACENGVIDLRRGDYDWMLAQFKAHAHKLWLAPDAAYLRKAIEAGTSAKKPESIKEETDA